MQHRPLGRTGLSIAPLVFGGNVFGWTADRATSFAILDRFVEAGFNAIDTADVYSRWAPGHAGGESEAIIGDWMADRRNRDQIVLVTKVGSDMGQGRIDLSGGYIARAVEDSLRRLKTDRIDVYLSHWHDPLVGYEETLAAFDALVKAGKVRSIGCSNHDAAQLRASLEVARSVGLPRYEVLQPEYNLYDRDGFEGALRDLASSEGLGVITYFGLARGFLSGKYRGEADLGQSPRGSSIGRYLNARGFAILAALDAVAARHGATPAEVAVAWLIAKDGVTAPIASATSVHQLESLIKAAGLRLDAAEMGELDRAGARAA